MPKGEYCISESEPIAMLNNLILDLNESTLKINSHGKQNITIVSFTSCENAKLINGTALGDRYDHDYSTIKGSHEWNTGVVFNDSKSCELNNITVKGFPGYFIS